MTMATNTARPSALVEEYAAQIRPLIPLAKRAYGSAKQGSPPRVASDRYNQLLLEYVVAGGNIKHLSDELGVAYATLSRRLRVARSKVQLGAEPFSTKQWGSRDPDVVAACAAQLAAARNESTEAYRDVVIRVHKRGVSLYAVAKALGVSYYSLWSAMRT